MTKNEKINANPRIKTTPARFHRRYFFVTDRFSQIMSEGSLASLN